MNCSVQTKSLILTICLFSFIPAYSQNWCGATDSLETPSLGGINAQAIMFDLVALNTITIECFDILDNGLNGNTFGIWTYPGSHVGHETDSTGWIWVGDDPNVQSAWPNYTPLYVDTDIQILAGDTQAFYIIGIAIEYSTGTSVGAVSAADNNLQILEGTGVSWPWNQTWSPRVFNGVVHYNPALSTSARPAADSRSEKKLRLLGANKVEVRNDSDNSEIYVTDASGQIVEHQVFMDTDEIHVLDLSNRQAGIYTVSLLSSSSIEHVRLFVSR